MAQTQPITYQPGQEWSLKAPEAFADTRAVVGMVHRFPDGQEVVCVMLNNVPIPSPKNDGKAVNIAFIPMARAAMDSSVLAQTGDGSIVAPFMSAFDNWLNDPEGPGIVSVTIAELITALAQQIMKNTPPNA